MKIRTEHPYYLGSFGAWLGAGVFGYMVTGNANTGMLMGLAAAGALVFYGLNKAKDFSDDIENPTPRIYELSEFEAFAAIKDALTNNIDDKWWIPKNVDDTPDEDGNMKMKYACNFDEPHPLGQAVAPFKRQIVIDVLVNRVSNQASVELHYNAVSMLNRFSVDDIIEKTNAMIFLKLDRLAAKRAAGPAVKAGASYEF